MGIYQGSKIDTHSFIDKLNREFQTEDKLNYFNNEYFTKTKFFVMSSNPQKNSEVVELVKKEDRFIGSYLIFNPNDNHTFLPYTEQDTIKNLDYLAQNSYVIGLKTVPSIVDLSIDNEKMFGYYETTIKNNMFMLIHCSGTATEYTSPEKIMNVCKKFPELKLILAHFGGVNLKLMSSAIGIAEQNKNVFLNTTAIDPLIPREQISNKTLERKSISMSYSRNECLKIFLEAYQRVPNQILFGSDLGYYPPEYYSDWPISELSEKDQKKIFLDNPLKEFKHKIKKTTY